MPPFVSLVAGDTNWAIVEVARTRRATSRCAISRPKFSRRSGSDSGRITSWTFRRRGRLPHRGGIKRVAEVVEPRIDRGRCVDPGVHRSAGDGIARGLGSAHDPRLRARAAVPGRGTRQRPDACSRCCGCGVWAWAFFLEEAGPRSIASRPICPVRGAHSTDGATFAPPGGEPNRTGNRRQRFP